MIPQDERGIRSRRLFKAARDALWDAFRNPGMVFDHAEETARIRPFVESANEQNFDRLQARLDTLRTQPAATGSTP